MLLPLRHFGAIFASALACLAAGCASSAPPVAAAPIVPARPAASPIAADASSKEAFTESALRLLRANAPEFPASVAEPLQLKVVTPVSNDMRVNLDRIWHLCQVDPQPCETTLRDFVSNVARTFRESETPTSRDAVLPVVRTRDYVEQAGDLDPAVGEAVAGDLWALYVIDSNSSVRSLTRAEVEKWGVAREELARIVRQNLARRLGALPASLGDTSPNTVGLIMRNEYFESSRLLLTEQWADIARRSGGKLLVAAPGHDVLLFCLNDDAASIAKMIEVARDLYDKASRPVSPSVLSWTAAGWKAVSAAP